MNDLWEFNFKTSQWNKIDYIGKNPTLRYGHSTTYSNDIMYSFGGYSKVDGTSEEKSFQLNDMVNILLIH